MLNLLNILKDSATEGNRQGRWSVCHVGPLGAIPPTVQQTPARLLAPAELPGLWGPAASGSPSLLRAWERGDKSPARVTATSWLW